jgi:hypothetical protein
MSSWGVIFSELSSSFIFCHRYNSARIVPKSPKGMSGMASNEAVRVNGNG